ncbi:MAG TPA: hypothetical protein VG942_12755 [Hyphomonadaceae bacterium]|nr:hypothetical protein [Hyphomonadaceae bacterium]
MAWRRLIGMVFMSIGAAVAVAMIILTALVLTNFLKWGDTLMALRTVAVVILPAIAAGVAALFIGRLAYGDLKESAPVTNASSRAVRMTGIVIAVGLGGMLAFLFFAGIGPDDATAAFALAGGMIAGGVLAFLGSRIKPINRRSYLK